MDPGILSYAIQCQHLLAMAITYGIKSLEKDDLLPWSAGSDYSLVQTSALAFESSLPAVHRFVTARFEDRPLQELETNHHYWSPWLLIQLAYHASHCLLNHPVLLSARLKAFRGIIPQHFLETSLKQTTVHFDWITHFVQMIDRTGYRVSDPLIDCCVAVAATVALQQKQAGLAEVCEWAKSGYTICINWLQKKSTIWLNITNVASFGF